MILYLLNAQFERIAIIDSYVSLIWTRRYWDVGDCELYIPANTDISYQNGMYLQKADDLNDIMRIDSIRLTEDSENGDYLTISGKGFENILASRIVWYKTKSAGNAEAALYSLFIANFLESDNANRNISALSVANLKGLTGTISGEFNGVELLEIVQTVCQANGYGFKFNGLQFEIYTGADRSSTGTQPIVIFSPDFGNVSSTDYTRDQAGHKNTCLAYAESSQSGYGRLLVTEGGNNAGFNRFETFVDCTTEEDTELMLNAAVDTLSEDKPINEFTGEIIPVLATNPYYLGDIIQLADAYGHTARARITEMIESDSAEGYSVIPTFEVIE